MKFLISLESLLRTSSNNGGTNNANVFSKWKLETIIAKRFPQFPYPSGESHVVIRPHGISTFKHDHVCAVRNEKDVRDNLLIRPMLTVCFLPNLRHQSFFLGHQSLVRCAGALSVFALPVCLLDFSQSLCRTKAQPWLPPYSQTYSRKTFPAPPAHNQNQSAKISSTRPGIQ